MPLPELNTGGVDIGNTLLKIRGMQNQDAENQYRSETLKNQNALRLLTEKRQLADDERAKKKEMYEQVDKVTSYIVAAPEPVQGALYEDYYNTSTEKGMPVPHPDVFKKDGVFDSKGFGTYVTRMKTLLNSKVGTTERMDVVNPKFNPKVPVSIDNPKFVTATFTITVDGPQLVEGAPITPKVDPIGKEAKDQEQQDKTFAETLRHNKKSEQQSDTTNARLQKGAIRNVDYRITSGSTKGQILTLDMNNPEHQKIKRTIGFKLTPVKTTEKAQINLFNGTKPTTTSNKNMVYDPETDDFIEQ